MASNLSSEYKVITDRIVSPDEDIIVTVTGAVYKGSIVEANRYVTVSDIGNAGAVSAEIEFEVEGGTLGTQPTFNGAPLFTGSYVVAGPTVHFRIDVDFDNITSFGTGQYYLRLPIAAKHNYTFASGCLHDISTGVNYEITGHVVAGETLMTLESTDNTGNSSFNIPFTYNHPVSLATADNFHLTGQYIADFS